MFTGLVQALGEVASLQPSDSGVSVVLRVPGWGSLVPPISTGESIAVSGCCLTVVAADPLADGVELRFDAIPQTIRMTHLGGLRVGGRVNLERAATPSTLLGGHIVQGHVDGVGRVEAVLREGGEWRVRLAPPRSLMPYVSAKGSIAVDGVSLTIADFDDARGTLDVCLIPETLVRTTLGERVAGDAVHLEADCLAKMVERLLAARGKG